MKERLIDLALWLFASPILVLRGLVRAYRNYGVLRFATAVAIPCECGAEISLVGLWRCSCGFTYRGHLMRACPLCGSIPSVVRCYRCGVTSVLPVASP